MKYADWKERLDEYVKRKTLKPFIWGTNDCYLFVAGAVRSMSGIDIAHWLWGKYSTKRGAIKEARKLSNNFEEFMIKIFDETLVRKDTGKVKYGDIVMAYIENLDPEATGRTSGVMTKNGSMMVPGEDMIAFVQDPKIDFAWEVPGESAEEGVMRNWPVVTGCYRLSEGCYSCPSYWEYVSNGEDYSPKIHDEVLNIPKMIPTPTTFQVAFGSDLFHENVLPAFIFKVFEVMNNCPQHNFEIITKRVKQVSYLNEAMKWTNNISLGVAVESGEYKWRIDYLRNTGAQTKFVSMAPLLGPMGRLDLSGIHLVGAVQETWGYKRPAKQEWFDEVERQCVEQGVPYTNSHITYKDKNKEVLTWQEQE